MRKHQDKVQIDSKHRICLGSFLSKIERENLSSFHVSRQNDGKIVLDPLVEIPAREHWIYQNPKALASLKRGLEDIEAGRLNKLDLNFSEFLEDEEI